MDHKYSRPLQILAPVFALILLSTYVLYSQRTHARNVAPGSKSMTLSGALARDAAPPAAESNADQTLRMLEIEGAFEPGRPFELLPNQAISAQPLENSMVASGSKSGPVFDFRTSVLDFRTAPPGKTARSAGPLMPFVMNTNAGTSMKR